MSWTRFPFRLALASLPAAALLLPIGIALLPPNPAAAAGPGTKQAVLLDEYLGRLARAEEFLRPPSPSGDGAAGLFPERERVRARGWTVEVDHGWLHAAGRRVDAIREEASRGAEAERLREILASAREALSAQAGGIVPRPVPQDAGERLQGILARREFQPPESEPWIVRGVPWLGRLLDWVEERLRRLVPAVRLPKGRAFEYVVGALLWTIVIALVAYVLRSLWPYLAGGQARREGPGPPAGRQPGPTDLEARARRLAEAGAYLQASSALYAAVLLRLDKAGALRYEASKTNREHLAEYRGPDRARGPFAELTATFEAFRYASAPCGKVEYRAFATACARLAEGGGH